MTPVPTGSVTFLFTDVEGSTRLWEDHPGEMRSSLARHDQILRDCVERRRGYIFSTAGDAFAVAFRRPDQALATALDAQRALASEGWDVPGGIRVRMGLHTGAADERDGDYFGPALNRAARLTSIGHGGQILVSSATAELLVGRLGGDVELQELGQHRLKDLARPETVWQVTAPGLERDFPPLRSATVAIGNLAVPQYDLVGRKGDLAGIEDQLASSRLVTILGSGGVGKTRLALEVGADLRPAFPRGVWFAELSQIREGSLVVHSVAALFGARTLPNLSLELSLAESLRRDELLLVLDNCEHVLAHAAALTEVLLSQCPGVRVLATSRQPLGAPGEIRWSLRPLPVGDLLLPGDAIELFVRRARAARAGFEVTPQNRAAVVHLCRRLDGLPLAIELAAARVATLNPQSLLERLDRRFSLLAGPESARSTHHHTLRAAIDWSHELLTAGEQVAFRRCAVFAGRFDLDAAETVVVGDELPGRDATAAFLSLVDKSLLETADGVDELRYVVLETIREYAGERLGAAGERDEVRLRHARCFAHRVREIGPGIAGPEEIRWHRQLDADLADIGAAVRWAVEGGQAQLAISLVAPLGNGILALRGDQSLLAWDVLAMTVVDDTSPDVDQLLAVALYDCYLNSDVARASALEARFPRALSEPSAPPCYLVQALLHAMQGDVAGAIRLNQRGAEVALEGGSDAWMGAAFTGMAACEWFVGDPHSVVPANEAVARLEQSGSPTWLAAALLQLARARMLVGEPDVAPILERAVEVGSSASYVLPVPYAHAHLGEICLEEGDYARGFDHFREAMVDLYRAQDISDLCYCLALFARAVAPLGHVADAVVLYEGVKRLAPHWLALPVSTSMVSSLDAAKASLPDRERDEIVGRADRVQVDGLVDLALALCDEG